MIQLNFDNRFVNELPGELSGARHSRLTKGACWATANPTPVRQPKLLAYSSEVMQLLNLSLEEVQSADFLGAFSGNSLLSGMTPYATCYGGHQFGNWAGQLGDGRAIALGEVVNLDNVRWELQLKGAGITPYSRRADGRAVLRSSLREFLCSEAMHHLGIPSTRALSLISTGEPILRDLFYDGNPRYEPGAIVCRVAATFTRFGHFEILAARGEYTLLKKLIDFTISRDYAHIDRASADHLATWFRAICEKTAELVVQWLRVGFVHGVMNTDNMSIIGLTIDYGPYGWMDNFDPAWTPNTTDAEHHRYCLARQAPVARWNLARLADALATVATDRSYLDEGLAHFDCCLQSKRSKMLASKLGLLTWRDEDSELAESLFKLMQVAQVDMTELFRKLADIKQHAPDLSILHSAFYQASLYHSHGDAFQAWLLQYVARLKQQVDTDKARRIRMNHANPRFILRNYLAQRAIEAALLDDLSLMNDLMAAARHPYDDDIPAHLTAKRPDWAINKPGCSTLSCSS
ncbi:MAG: YdiU family protein [Gallionella sp.]